MLLGAVIIAISAGFIPNIAMEALAAYIQCRPAQTCNGTSQGDAVFGTDRADNISGWDGGDSITARGGDDTVSGGSGGDAAITGSSGEDTLNGNDGSDALVGGSGNDNLNGGGGDDTLTGGPGEGEFDCGDGTDTVTDFNEAEGDTAEDNCENVSYHHREKPGLKTRDCSGSSEELVLGEVRD